MNQPEASRQRCPWCGEDPLYRHYHDHEWGVPLHDDHKLFELLTLEGAQAGLSWITVLKKRERYRQRFAGFDPAIVATFGPQQVDELLTDPGLIRNRRKIESAINNARAVLTLQARHGSFAAFLWDMVDGEPQINRFRVLAEVPAKTALSDRMAKALKQAGFNFVGSTICYAMMQSIGIVNDHLLGCFRHPDNL